MQAAHRRWDLVPRWVLASHSLLMDPTSGQGHSSQGQTMELGSRPFLLGYGRGFFGFNDHAEPPPEIVSVLANLLADLGNPPTGTQRKGVLLVSAKNGHSRLVGHNRRSLLVFCIKR